MNILVKNSFGIDSIARSLEKFNHNVFTWNDTGNYRELMENSSGKTIFISLEESSEYFLRQVYLHNQKCIFYTNKFYDLKYDNYSIILPFDQKDKIYKSWKSKTENVYKSFWPIFKNTKTKEDKNKFGGEFNFVFYKKNSQAISDICKKAIENGFKGNILVKTEEKNLYYKGRVSFAEALQSIMSTTVTIIDTKQDDRFISCVLENGSLPLIFGKHKQFLSFHDYESFSEILKKLRTKDFLKSETDKVIEYCNKHSCQNFYSSIGRCLND